MLEDRFNIKQLSAYKTKQRFKKRVQLELIAVIDKQNNMKKHQHLIKESKNNHNAHKVNFKRKS